MNRMISWLQSNKLRQILTVFLIALTLLISTAFDIHGDQLQAQAEPVTPEATQYKVDPNKSDPAFKAERIKEDAEKSAKILADEGKQVRDRATEYSQEKGKNLFETVKEKLNLDEPIDPGTKQAAEQLKETVTGRE